MQVRHDRKRIERRQDAGRHEVVVMDEPDRARVEPRRHLRPGGHQEDAPRPRQMSFERSQAELEQLEVVACAIGIAVVAIGRVLREQFTIAGPLIVDPRVHDIDWLAVHGGEDDIALDTRFPSGDNKCSFRKRFLVKRMCLTLRGLALVVCLTLGIHGAAAAAQSRPSAGGVIDGVVTTQSGSIRLGGAQVVVRDTSDREIATLLSEGDGHFRVVALPPGTYRVLASLEGFEPGTVQVVVAADKIAETSLDLSIATISQVVEVVGTKTIVSSEGTLSPAETITAAERDQYTPGGGLQGALRMLASIIVVPGGVSIKGGRPSQASVQLGPNTLVNPATGLTHVSLPDDAIDSVSVLSNPYAVEYGRFSSGLVVINTRRAGDEWKLRLNNLDPTFRTKRGGSPFDVKGIGVFGPRTEIGGPIVTG